MRSQVFSDGLNSFGIELCSISALNETKKRISEIEVTLRNVRELKIKEEHELSEWERELETIKSRLEKIDKDLFSKV